MYRGDVLMANGDILDCVLKRVDYDDEFDKQAAQSELDGLLIALGQPCIVQGVAAFHHFCPRDKRDYMWIATRSGQATL